MGVPVPKPNHKRWKMKKSKRSEFSKKVREQIWERDEGLCRNCFSPGHQIHHVKPKGFGNEGRGVFTNGLLVCASCHQRIHADPDLMKQWQSTFEKIYGPDYFRDKYDLLGVI